MSTLNEKVFKPNGISPTFFGSYLFRRRVSGVRVCATSEKLQKVGQVEFTNYGTHSDNYPVLPYFTSAAAIGQSKHEIEVYIGRLDAAFKHFYSGEAIKEENAA